MPDHKSGFVNIIGRPNAGKSTLMNALVGERMSIITAKPQTTRHRIIGILSEPDFQIVFSDTPGYIEQASYKMQEKMNSYVNSSFEDADVMIYLVDPQEEYTEDDLLVGKLRRMDTPLFLVFNKLDLVDENRVNQLERQFKKWIKPQRVFGISAQSGLGVSDLLDAIKTELPEGPVYFPEDQLTDRSERFFVSEIIREQILEQYHQEIPYSVEIEIETFEETETKDGEELARISAVIYVSRKTQKPILIGKGGSSIKKLGTNARKRMEEFLGRKVFLETHVKIREDWRDDEAWLKRFGYDR
ncbi:GTP-binding protein Era [Neolewinella xylanilytica]|uniref:GTPase Era n=1 Tax=Neolewinella xylanilytica TaxID=1514080 RepID=A0A2S6I8V3_9BACT|nr:GTPase Era [Neolewinella xylanilytica]PPK87908.1 GTP-binding protein Era [Neolewinella xylanilytica]